MSVPRFPYNPAPSGPGPTALLVAEHEVILQVLASLDRILRGVEGGREPERDVFLSVVEFCRGYADARHHAKEENFLFPALAESGVSVERGPIGVMLAEHVEGREYIRGLAESVEDLGRDRARARTGVLDSGWGYLNLLRAHIHKENEILFPMAERVLPPARRIALQKAFDRVDAEMGTAARDRFLALAAEIDRRSRV